MLACFSKIKSKYKLAILLIIIFTATIWTGCIGKKERVETPPPIERVEEREGGLFRFQLTSDPGNLDPAAFNFQNQSAKQLMYLLYRGLVAYHHESLEIVPSIANKWSVSEDGLIYTFYLNEGIIFHNGNPINAQTFKDSWERILAPGKNFSNRFVFMDIVGAGDKLNGRVQETVGIRVLDELTLQVQLATPNSAFLSMMAHPSTFPVDTELVNRAGDSFGQTASSIIGAGPFKMVEWHKNKELVLEKNENYFGYEPYIQRLEMPIIPDSEEALVLLEAGKLHYIQEVPIGRLAQIRNDQQLSPLLIETPFLASYYYSFNIHKPPLDNVKIRQALNFAVDRELIIEHLWENLGTPLGGVVPQGFANYPYPKNAYTFNLPMAKKLLEDAGYPLGFGLPDLVLTYNDTPGHRAIAKAVQQQLAQVGVRVVLEEVSWEQLIKNMQNLQGDIFRLGWIADYPDVDSFLYNQFSTQAIGKGNYLKYSNSLVDELLTQARRELNLQKRNELYALAESYLIADAPMLWLFGYDKAVMRGDYVKGLHVNQLGVVNLELVWLEGPN